MKPGEVAELLGIDAKDVRARKGAPPATPLTDSAAATGAANGGTPQSLAER